MSDTIWVQVRGRADDEPQDCSILLKLSGRLDRLARQLGVTPPSEFHDHSSLAEDYADEFDIPEGAVPENWTDVATGLASISAILTLLRTDPATLNFHPKADRAHWPEMLLDELAHAEDRLTAAGGGEFRFLIMM